MVSEGAGESVKSLSGPGSRVPSAVPTMATDPAAPWFRCTDRERAAFEAGIKLGAMFHQFTGLPVSTGNAEAVERAMEGCLKVQPWVEAAEVRIDRARLPGKAHEYDYTTLTGEMFSATVRVRYGEAVAHAGLEYVAELKYPLMHLRFHS